MFLRNKFQQMFKYLFVAKCWNVSIKGFLALNNPANKASLQD